MSSVPPNSLPHNPDEAQIRARLQGMREDFIAQGPAPLALRRDRLRRAIDLLKTHEARICELVSQDFGGRHAASTLMMDVQAPIGALKYAHAQVGRWMKPQRRAGIFPFNLFGARSELRYQPKGVVGIAGTWNGPLYMLFAPLAGVLAAGNRAMLKPSDMSPALSQWLAETVPQYFDPLELSVVSGDLEVAQAFTRQAFDHLVFTGSGAVARQVMRAAAENLVPLTLELGGKSPTVIGRSADLAQVVDKLSLARAQNGGQICVMPDTVYVPRERLQEFVDLMRAQWLRMFPATTGNADLTAIASERHLRRFETAIAEAAEAGARIECLGAAPAPDAQGDRRRALHLVIQAPAPTAIAREEIFGPAMAVEPYEQIEQVLARINAGPRPLALYYFGRDRREQELVLERSHSGGAAVNDAMLQVGMHDVPFGGVGASGMGRYNGPEGFAEFSHLRGVYHAGWWDPRRRLGMVPPYAPGFVKMMREAIGRS